MRKSKLLSALLPTTVLASTLVVLPLSSCSNSSKHVKLSEFCDANQTLDDNNEVTFILVLDSQKEVNVAFDGEDQGFKLDYKQSGNMVRVTLKFLSRVNEETTFDIAFKVTSSSWTESLSGLSVLVKAVAEQKEVDEVNNIIIQDEELGIKAKTMSEVVALLKAHDKDIESFETSDNTSQWVWDSNANRIFVLNDNGTIKSAPKDYSLSKYKVNIWKMVGANQSRNLRSFSRNDIKIDAFSSTCQYSQYLRSDAVFEDKSLTFCSGLDTGDHSGFDLKFVKDETLTTEQPKAIINTNKCSLTVDSELNDIEHHGHLTSLTINEMPDDGVYTEFGTVDARVILNSGAIVAESGSSINDIVITSDDAIGIEVKAEATVGAVLATDDVSAEKVENLVVVDEGATKPTIVEEKQDPEQELYYAGGIGTKTSPYAIQTKQQLFNCANDVNTSTLSATNTLCFKLIDNIDLNNEEWTPIGSKTNNFYGIFDGQNYTVSNMKLSGTYSNKTLGFGLFGYTNGTANANFESLEGDKGIWDNTEKTLKSENIAESNYSTVIKNVTLDNVDIQLDGDARCVGGIVGVCQNTYVSNCTVKSGIIHSIKAVGGIAGDICGAICVDCIAGNEEENAETLTIKGDEYNIGGIVGACDYYTDVTGTCNCITNCSTGSNCTITVTDCLGGRIAGIVAYYDVTNVVAIEGCTNNARIESHDTGSSDDACIAGIAAREHTSLIANCVNNGSISVEGTSKVQNAAGILVCPGNTKLYNCINRGSIVANATNSVAGVVAGCDNAGLPLHVGDDIEFEVGCCWNESTTISNPLDETRKSDICDKIIGITFADTTFDNVEQVNNIIKNAGSTATQINFKNCTLTDPSGSITLPTSVSTIVADSPICENITVNNNITELNVFIPNQSITVTQQTDCAINSYSTNNTITIAQGASIKSAKVCGAGSKIINNGEVKKTIEVSNEASESTNNGTCRNVRFGNSTEYIKQPVTFTNNGTIKCVGDSAETDNNVISLHTLNSRPNITIKNYGTIEYQNNGLATPGNVISYDIIQGPGYLYNHGQVTLECYDGSQTITDCHNFFNSYSSIPTVNSYATLKWEEGCTINDNGLTTFAAIQDYYKNTVGSKVNITVEEM